MKTFEIRFEPVTVKSPHGNDLVEAARTMEVDGETYTIEAGLMADYLHIRDGKGGLLFTCKVTAISYCRQLQKATAKLCRISPEGVNHG